MTERPMSELLRDQKPLKMTPAASVAEACRAMHERRVGAVLVVEDEDRLVGIFTGRDAVRCLAEGCDAKHTTLDKVMTRGPVTLAPEKKAMDALRLLHDAGFRHLPVVCGGRVIGIVSRYDFRAREHARHDDETAYFEMIR